MLASHGRAECPDSHLVVVERTRCSQLVVLAHRQRASRVQLSADLVLGGRLLRNRTVIGPLALRITAGR